MQSSSINLKLQMLLSMRSMTRAIISCTSTHIQYHIGVGHFIPAQFSSVVVFNLRMILKFSLGYHSLTHTHAYTNRPLCIQFICSLCVALLNRDWGTLSICLRLLYFKWQEMLPRCNFIRVPPVGHSKSLP